MKGEEKMRNPAAIKQPKLKPPINARQKSKRKKKGNLPYLRFRRRLRKDIFGKM